MLLKQLLYSKIELLNWPQKRLICSSDLVQTAEENNKTTCKTIGPRRKKPGLRGPRPAWASAQTDQRICFSHFGKYHI